MRKYTDASEAGRQYATAHAAHYGTEDLRGALELYLDLIAAHPDAQEAEYSRSQVQNIVKAVVPRQQLLDAQVDCALAHFEPADQQKVSRAPVTPRRIRAAHVHP